MLERLSPEARVAVGMAYTIAGICASQEVETEHLLLAIMRENPAFLNRFLKTKVTGDPISEVIHENVAKGHDFSQLKGKAAPKRTEEFERVIAFAAEEAQREGKEDSGIDHLLVAILREVNSIAAKMLRDRGADLDLIRFQLAAQPHEAPSKQEQKIRALNRIMNSLESSHPSTRARIAEIRSRIEQGDDIADISDEVMEIMGDGARAERNPERSSAPPNPLSEKVRRLVFFAQFEAKRSGCSEVETEHLLLVVLREQKKYLDLFLPLASSKDSVCVEIEQTLCTTENISPLEAYPVTSRPPLSEECSRAQIYAREEATRLLSPRVGTEHLLLGLLRDESTFASRTMRKYGAELEKIRTGLAARSSQSSSKSDHRLQ
jgi:ATP-dependent Clp protease ATP-binding subunit ClpA